MSPDLKAAVQRQKKKDASVAAPVPTPTPTPTPDVAKEDPNQLQTPKVFTAVIKPVPQSS